MQGHRLVNDELRQLIRNEDDSEPSEDDFGFDGQETLQISAPGAGSKAPKISIHVMSFIRSDLKRNAISPREVDQGHAAISLRNCIVNGCPSTLTLVVWASPSSGIFAHLTANVSAEI
mgnify:CR=1 FL=1